MKTKSLWTRGGWHNTPTIQERTRNRHKPLWIKSIYVIVGSEFATWGETLWTIVVEIELGCDNDICENAVQKNVGDENGDGYVDGRLGLHNVGARMLNKLCRNHSQHRSSTAVWPKQRRNNGQNCHQCVKRNAPCKPHYETTIAHVETHVQQQTHLAYHDLVKKNPEHAANLRNMQNLNRAHPQMDPMKPFQKNQKPYQLTMLNASCFGLEMHVKHMWKRDITQLLWCVRRVPPKTNVLNMAVQQIWSDMRQSNLITVI